MRISVKKDDKGYDPHACWNYIVFCDGVELPDCHTADEELGLAWSNERLSDGSFVVKANHTIGSVEVKGKIEIKPKDKT